MNTVSILVEDAISKSVCSRGVQPLGWAQMTGFPDSLLCLGFDEVAEVSPHGTVVWSLESGLWWGGGFI